MTTRTPTPLTPTPHGLRELLQGADPTLGQPDLSSDELAATARGILARAVDADGSGDDADGGGLARRRHPRRRILTAAAAVAMIAAGLSAPVLGHTPAATAQAAVLLQRAADAVDVSDPAAEPDQWWKVTTTGENLVVSVRTGGVWSSAIVRGQRVEYRAVDGSRPSVFRQSAQTITRLLSGSAGADTAQAARTWTEPAPSLSAGSWANLTPAFLADLPRDPEDLRRRIEADTAGQGVSRDGEVFVSVTDALSSGLIPADLRAALYRVLADLPGVVVTGEAAIEGRRGTSFAYPETNGVRQELLIDTETGELVGEREVALRGDDSVPAGTVVESLAVTRELVDDVPPEPAR